MKTTNKQQKSRKQTNPNSSQNKSQFKSITIKVNTNNLNTKQHIKQSNTTAKTKNKANKPTPKIKQTNIK